MHIAIHNWMRAEPIETTLSRISSQGYHALEIEGSPDAYDTAHVKSLLDDHGLTCWGSVTLMLGERNLLARTKAQRDASIQYVKDVIKMVADLEGKMVSVVPGTVGKVVPDGRPDEEWKWAITSLKECVKYADDFGIKIGLEPINRFETHFLNRGDQALALAQEVSDNCGVCLDIFHMNLEENDYYEIIKRAATRLVGFHVADNNRMAPGMGRLDWPKIISTLKEVGYDGALSVEFCPSLDRTPANPYPGSIDENPEGQSPEQLKFLEDHGSSSFTEKFYAMLTQKSLDTLLPLI